MNKVMSDIDAAVADIGSGSSLAVGGFGLCGVPVDLIDAISRSGVNDLHVISNNCGTDDVGLGVLLTKRRVSRVTASYVGENAEFARQYVEGEIEVELVPQGSLAERLRAGGSGIPAFFLRSGVGTLVGDGGLPWRYGADGEVAVASPRKEAREFDGEVFILERAITPDFALVRAGVADRSGNLNFHAAARNFNPVCAMAARFTIVEAEQIVETGSLDPDEIHLPGIYVDRVVPTTPNREKVIERLTTRPIESRASQC